jgi:hypothetical protein
MEKTFDISMLRDYTYLFKFTQKERVDGILDGKLYMKNLQYFVDKEISSGDMKIGDELEAQAKILNTKANFYDVNTNELICTAKASDCKFDPGYLKCPVYCMFSFGMQNVRENEISNNKVHVTYSFTDEQKEELKGFGDKCIIIKDSIKFRSRVYEAKKIQNVVGYEDYVKYYTPNNKEHLVDIFSDNKRFAFWKRQSYASQCEYRILIDAEVDDFFILDIGDIRDIAEVKEAEQILNSRLEFEYIPYK